MAGITLEQSESELQEWIKAASALKGSQSYSMDGRMLTRANLGEVREMIDYWDGKVKTLSRRGPGFRRGSYR